MGKRKKKKRIVRQLFSGETFAGSITSGIIVSLIGFLAVRLLQRNSGEEGSKTAAV